MRSYCITNHAIVGVVIECDSLFESEFHAVKFLTHNIKVVDFVMRCESLGNCLCVAW